MNPSVNQLKNLSKAGPDPLKDGKRSGARITVESLIRNDVKVIFGFPGGAVIPLYDEIMNFADQVRHIMARHEQGAVHAAQGYARVTGRTGVAIATSGPGASNLITGLTDAHLDSNPLVVLGGQVATSLIGSNAFQECDMMGMTNCITKHNFQCRNIEELEEIIDQAFYIASTGRPGPVYIDLPKDVQMQTTANGRSGPLDLPYYVTTRPVDPHALARAVTLIQSAKRPLLVMGNGVVQAGASEVLGDFARSLGIPVVTTVLSKGVFDEFDPLSVGAGGMHGRRVANYAFTHCDVLIAFGCRFSDRVTGNPKAFEKNKKIVHVDIDPYEIGKNLSVHVELNADALDVAKALNKEMGDTPNPWPKWSDKIKRYRSICNQCIESAAKARLLPKQLMGALNHVLADDDVVVTGVGQHQMFAAHYLYRSKPRTFITSGGAGTMGFGLPAAIGAAVGNPNSNTWLLDGDGSLQMTVQELGTLAAIDEKVIIVVMDNGYLGMVRQWQELFHDRRYSSVELNNNPDFVKLADAYGLEGRRADSMVELKEALSYARDAENSVLIHVPVEKESNIMPMVSPGASLADTFGECVKVKGEFFAKEELKQSDCSTGENR